jgi:hypothetical protein
MCVEEQEGYSLSICCGDQFFKQFSYSEKWVYLFIMQGILAQLWIASSWLAVTEVPANGPTVNKSGDSTLWKRLYESYM